MASNRRIVNVSNGFALKFHHAERAVQNCAAEWVEYGVSIRSLTLSESIKARNEQAALREPLPWAELPGLIVRGIAGTRDEMALAMEARKFAAGVAA